MSRSNVDLPQPDGPRMVTRSLSAIRQAGRLERARRRAAPHPGRNTRDTFSMTSLLMECTRAEPSMLGVSPSPKKGEG